MTAVGIIIVQNHGINAQLDQFGLFYLQTPDKQRLQQATKQKYPGPGESVEKPFNPVKRGTFLFQESLNLGYCMADGISGRIYPVLNLDRFVRDPREPAPALHSCLVEMANRAVGQTATLPWQGKIFLVQGRLVYLSSGQYSGLVSGRRLLVNGLRNPVRDPRTGMVVGSRASQGSIAGATIIW